MKIKKIALVSVHSDPNYGSMLQAYALSTSLFRMGYDNEYINYSPYKEKPCIVQFVINLVKRHLSLSLMLNILLQSIRIGERKNFVTRGSCFRIFMIST